MAKKRSGRHKIAVLDFETDPFERHLDIKPFAGGIFDGEYYQDFWGDDCVELIVEYIREEMRGYTIYAHNGGKFDYFFMLEYLDEKLKIINGRISKCYIDGIELRDSYNILPVPLSKLNKDDFDYTKMHRSVRDSHKSDIRRYLKNDCIYLHDWVTKFINRFGDKITVSAAAFSELKKTGYDPGTTNDHYDSTFREYYLGGRVNAFKTGEIIKDSIFVDINSAYSRAMIERHPFGDRYYQKLKIPDNYNSPYLADIDAVSNGVLPFRDDETGKLVYPTDTTVRRYKCTGWEIAAGIDTGKLDIKRVNNVYVHEQTRSISEYVDKFYPEKKRGKESGDKTTETFAKFMLNAGYGKLGQNPREFRDFCLTPNNCVPEDYDPELDDNWTLYQEHVTGVNIWERPAPQDRFYNVATAASITGWVRAYLWRAICDSENPIYCDTDSLLAEKFNGKIGKELGEWDIDALVDKSYIGGRKFYAVHNKNTGEWKTACKGGRLTPVQIINEIKNGGGYVWESDTPTFSLRFGMRYLSRKISRQF